MNKNTEPHEIWRLLCFDERIKKHTDIECESREEAESLIRRGIESTPIYSIVRNFTINTTTARTRVYVHTSNGDELLMDFYLYRDTAQEWCDDTDCVECRLNEHEERIEEAETDIVELNNRVTTLLNTVGNWHTETVNRLDKLEYKFCKENDGTFSVIPSGKDVESACEIMDKLKNLLSAYIVLRSMDSLCGEVVQIPIRHEKYEEILNNARMFLDHVIQRYMGGYPF